MKTHAWIAWSTLSGAVALFSSAGCGGDEGGAGSATNGGQTSSASAASGTNGPGGDSSSSGEGGAGVGGAGGSGGGGGVEAEKRVAGYFVAWGVYARNYHVADIPADKLTHINYGFADLSDAGECELGDPYADTEKAYAGDSQDPGALRGSFHQLQVLKIAHPTLRTLISVGGWTLSSRFSSIAASPASRSKFAQSCVAFMAKYGFDGIDIDWEYPVSGGLATNQVSPADKQNYTLLLAALRSELKTQGDADGRHYELTIAAPASPSIMQNLELGKIHASLDAINIMAYDFHGAWDITTNFNAPLYASSSDPSSGEAATKFNADAAVKGYLDAGVPASKLVLGVPFYGRGYKGVSAAANGLYQSHTGAAPGTWEVGLLDYEDIKNNYLPSYTRHWHEEAKVPWLYSAQADVMISYDDPESIALKATYAKTKGLGGVMLWELSGDDAQGSLLTALSNAVQP